MVLLPERSTKWFVPELEQDERGKEQQNGHQADYVEEAPSDDQGEDQDAEDAFSESSTEEESSGEDDDDEC